MLLPFVARDPALATVQGDFASPAFSGDLAGLGPSAVQAIFDDRLTNLAATVQSGVDLTTGYAWTLDPGEVNPYRSLVERLLENKARTVYFAPAISELAAFAEPPAWKGRAAAVFTGEPVTLSAAINYVNSYRNSLFHAFLSRLAPGPRAMFILATGRATRRRCPCGNGQSHSA